MNNPYAPADLFDALANSKDWQIRVIVARNLAVPAQTLARLRADPIEGVRMAAGA